MYLKEIALLGCMYINLAKVPLLVNCCCVVVVIVVNVVVCFKGSRTTIFFVLKLSKFCINKLMAYKL